MTVFDEASETMVICPHCMQDDARQGADPKCKVCGGVGMVSGKAAAEFRSASDDHADH